MAADDATSWRAPRWGAPIAVFASAALVALIAFGFRPDAWETLATGLRHSAVAAADAFDRPDQTLGTSERPVRTPPGPLGANVLLEQEVETAKRRRALEALRALGVTWIRQQLPWEQIEPAGKGDYVDPKFNVSTWAKYDEILGLAESLGIQVVFRLDTSPRWALPPDAVDGLGPPVRFEDYWDFVEAVATRYRGRVLAYQVWNEPNLHIEWGRRPPDPAGYAALLRGAAERIRRADPQAQVVLAALSPTLTENAEALNDLVYLQRLYDAGIRGSYDVLAVQAYGLRGGPDDRRLRDQDVNLSRPLLVRDVMVRNGDGATPVWATEFGWNSTPPELGDQPYGRVTPVLQARYAVRGLERVAHEWPWLRAVAVWFLKLPEHWDPQPWHYFALLDPDFRPNPAYYALRDRALAEPGRATRTP